MYECLCFYLTMRLAYIYVNVCVYIYLNIHVYTYHIVLCEYVLECARVAVVLLSKAFN